MYILKLAIGPILIFVGAILLALTPNEDKNIDKSSE